MHFKRWHALKVLFSVLLSPFPYKSSLKRYHGAVHKLLNLDALNHTFQAWYSFPLHSPLLLSLSRPPTPTEALPT